MDRSLREGLKRFLTSGQLELLASARVGIAGAGGLGSNAAMLLARTGIEHMVIADYDIIEPSNLNRQHFWPSQLGEPKVEALARHLQSLNSNINLELIREPLNAKNIKTLASLAPVWIEALDQPETKKIFAEDMLLAGNRVFAASGIAGFGGAPMRKRRMGNLTLIGDFNTDAAAAPTLAPKVMQAAALLADSVIESILGNNG